jgi:hypothetical protein
MPATHIIWQLRRCDTPFTVTLHSMQMPMPQSGARASPSTENRHGSPAIIIAAATLVPAATCIGRPFTVSNICTSANVSSSFTAALAAGSLRV